MTLSGHQREAISYAMSLQYFNKCVECCLVPGCHTCGRCDDHDDATEAELALEWVNEYAGLF